MTINYDFLSVKECWDLAMTLQLFSGHGTNPEKWNWDEWFTVRVNPDFRECVSFKATDALKEKLS